MASDADTDLAMAEPDNSLAEYKCPHCGQKDFRLAKRKAPRRFLYQIRCANCRFFVGTGFPI